MTELPTPDYAVPTSLQSDAVAYATMWVRLVLLLFIALTFEVGLIVLSIGMPFLLGMEFHGRAGLSDLLGLLLALFLILMLIWFLWSSAPVIAVRLFSGTTIPAGFTGRVGRSSALSIALVLFGVYELVNGVAAAIHQVELFLVYHQGLSTPSLATWAGFVNPVFRLCVGLWLVLGTRKVLSLVLRFSGRVRDDARVG